MEQENKALTRHDDFNDYLFSDETRHKLDDNDTLPSSPFSFLSPLDILSFSVFAVLCYF